MKKILLSLFLVLSVAFVASSFVSAQANPNPVLGPVCTSLLNNMKLGSTDTITNGEVTLLQNFYITNGFLTIANPTGFYGVLTMKSTKLFQTQYGLIPDGKVGLLTRAKIKLLTCSTVQALSVINNNSSSGVSSTSTSSINVNNPSVTSSGNTSAAASSPVINTTPSISPNTNPVSTVISTTNPNTTISVNPNVATLGCLPPNLFNTITGQPCSNGITVCNDLSAPYVIVGSPNGAESYQFGQQVEILWKSCNVPATTNLVIDLLKQSNSNPSIFTVYNLVKQTVNDGSEVIALAPQIVDSSFSKMPVFKIRISYTQSINTLSVGSQVLLGVVDESDNLFSILP